AWYVAAFPEELKGRDFLPRRILDVPLVLVQGAHGRLAALEDMCPHRLLPLSMGRRCGDELQCGYHGLKFTLDGRCSETPGQQQIPSAAQVRTFPLVQK